MQASPRIAVYCVAAPFGRSSLALLEELKKWAEKNEIQMAVHDFGKFRLRRHPAGGGARLIGHSQNRATPHGPDAPWED
jgi:hypothetical protein